MPKSTLILAFAFALVAVDSFGGEEVSSISHNVPLDNRAHFDARIAEMLLNASAEELNRNVMGEDHTLSLHARWRSMVGGSPRSETVELLSLARFAGLLEGRLRTRIPTWWYQWLAINHGSPNEYIERWGQPRPVQLHEEFQMFGEGIAITLSDRGEPREVRFTFPRPPSRSLINDRNRSVTIDSKFVFVCDYAVGLDDFPIYCFDLETRALNWEAQVWGTQLPLGNPTELVQIEANKDCIFVFGATNGVNFLEGFDRTTGKPVLRFKTTSYTELAPAGRR